MNMEYNIPKDSNESIIIDYSHPSKNFNRRISSLVMHYTALDLEESLTALTGQFTGVSAHYLVPKTALDGARKVFNLVPDHKRSWHAGVSAWKNRTNLNDTSIGIEIVNLGYKDENGKRIWEPFTDYQIETIILLAKQIVQDYGIKPTNIVGHADIAPGRKQDPGPFFPWKKLYENGVGAFYDASELDLKQKINIDIEQLQKDLKTYGYPVNITGTLDIDTRNTLISFQMHFRPSNYSGEPDAETVAILKNLIKKYCMI
ncbi:N-acetylmuramoyl-L-alanine amidase [Cardinium endosymbiont of Encarsia pergandiella]|uniref:N-acetylmuramoyl-L-alanine amidase n=1 Tax=Cardinium endosymbiont of Encarsia pergandiella TaxID=249402 RepID=UPI0004BAD1AF|nr:N-acetylmuramoyl-L-alanine amidase [Cardinium endosymbiont of Encarsia pergandiella]